eukprot:CAMPEP_0114596448 /NCGR_PEP_ID=MMETSP0125-20121206/18444_1 /TAXON_ID=485358 ORGANISM="Aristerostoma sp., Strain ATCC 50986" /NCGR_SAMPLE_ID=MMETSP0125 /ASSEMBLY_ACC=CAM_ASM_000245 /LENGTH=49 /DNA_ID=CAMNT_0001799441 /DNA_START=54 /DNA_END=203 /DNA_ORIENTATION=-
MKVPKLILTLIDKTSIFFKDKLLSVLNVNLSDPDIVETKQLCFDDQEGN